MIETALIEDGYSCETTIPRAPGIHPRVSLRYRPALSAERHQFMIESNQAASGELRVRRVAAILARHLERWDVVNGRGEPVAIKDEASIRRLKPSLLEKVLDLILGYTGPQEADDEKNSSPGSGSNA